MATYIKSFENYDLKKKKSNICCLNPKTQKTTSIVFKATSLSRSLIGKEPISVCLFRFLILIFKRMLDKFTCVTSKLPFFFSSNLFKIKQNVFAFVVRGIYKSLILKH